MYSSQALLSCIELGPQLAFGRKASFSLSTGSYHVGDDVGEDDEGDDDGDEGDGDYADDGGDNGGDDDDGDGGDGDDEFDDTDADTNITKNVGSQILSFGIRQLS